MMYYVRHSHKSFLASRSGNADQTIQLILASFMVSSGQIQCITIAKHPCSGDDDVVHQTYPTSPEKKVLLLRAKLLKPFATSYDISDAKFLGNHCSQLGRLCLVRMYD